ncbi:hypothetical protein HK103_001077 [Boothiomyces macroporosus]|uniref:Ribosomal RNA-processing protein 14/surfeit locus protein 6 C-terminal domain-containing protein n=1 Tax=Boothiomyces macroporosus TaxID=261099 RepID=A0AAD5UB85_9FUNG|nr:hypothetical protein HK103_001077 [Boothiomyces macroporosus]
MALLEQIIQNQKQFDHLIQLIPPKYYFPIEHLDDQGGKYGQNKKQKAPKQAIKDATKKAKKQKLDPESKTTVEIQQEKEQTMNFQPMANLNPVELKEKLKMRIEELRNQRGVTEKIDRKELLEKRRLKKQEKKQKRKETRKSTSDTLGMRIELPEKEKPEIKQELMFGKLDFGEKQEKKSIDPASRLKIAQQKKEKLELLKQTDEKKAKAIEESESWNKLIKQAQGEKPKDDLKLLKKTVKRQKVEKKKSEKEWKERINTVKKAQEKQQQKRNENLEARKKKGKGKPGFK